MASAQREAEKSGVRGVAAEVAAAGPSRLAGVASPQTARSSSPPGHRSAECSPTTLTRTVGRLPASALAVDRRSRRPPPVPAVYSALPSSGVSGSLRRTTALPGTHSVSGRAGLPAVHQCRLEDGAARHLDRMERPGASGQPSPRRQQRTLPDPALGRGASLGQPHSVFGRSSTPHRLAGRLWCAPPAVGDPGGPALHGERVDLGGRPLLLETLVDRPYTGTCYRAANWIWVGQTQGRGRMDRTHEAQGTCKDILLYPLESHGRHRLCQSPAPQVCHALTGEIR